MHAEDQKEFDYNEEGKRGPSHWGDLKREWHSCKAGLMQSPIDLLHERVRIVPHFTNLKTEYKPSNATLKNRGHDIMVIVVISTLLIIMFKENPFEYGL